jgi:hypothetical protein
MVCTIDLKNVRSMQLDRVGDQSAREEHTYGR